MEKEESFDKGTWKRLVFTKKMELYPGLIPYIKINYKFNCLKAKL